MTPHNPSPFRATLLQKLRAPAPATARIRWTLVLLGVATAAGPFVSHLHKAFDAERPHGDWFSIYSIAKYSWDTGELEADEADTVVRTQRYPPITRPLLMLLATLPKEASAVLSFGLFAGLYVWSAAAVSRIFLAPSNGGRWLGAALCLGLVLPYVWSDLTAGNVTSVLLGSATAAFVLDRRGRPLRAGLALSIGVMLKMIPVLCLAYFLVRRRWRVAWGTAAGVLLLGVLPSLVLFGPRKLWNYHGYWYRAQFSMYTPLKIIDNPVECTYQNQAVARTLVRWFTRTNAGSSRSPFYVTLAEPPRVVIKVVYVVVMAATALAWLAAVWRNRRALTEFDSAASYALCVGAMLWFSPWIGSYYYSLAMWPAAALLGRALTTTETGVESCPRWTRAVLWTWLLAMPAIGSRLLRACGIHTWAAAALLVGLAISGSRGTPDRRPARPFTGVA